MTYPFPNPYRSWALPPDDDGELSAREQRDCREAALHDAVLLHGEYESQPAFRSDETERVLETARRFYDWIVNGDPVPEEEEPECLLEAPSEDAWVLLAQGLREQPEGRRDAGES